MWSALACSQPRHPMATWYLLSSPPCSLPCSQEQSWLCLQQSAPRSQKGGSPSSSSRCSPSQQAMWVPGGVLVAAWSDSVWNLALKLKVEEQNSTISLFSPWLPGLKSHHCHGYGWDDPGMEILWSCSTSWGSSLWNVSLSRIKCWAVAFPAPCWSHLTGIQSGCSHFSPCIACVGECCV